MADAETSLQLCRPPFSELRAVALPLLGYFFCMIAVLTATAVATISFFSTSTSERVHHYPRPVVERNVTATNEEPRLFMVVPDTKDIPPTKNTEANPASIPGASPNASIPTEKAEIKKSKPHKPKVFARLRNNYERRGYYGNTPGYAQETQYGLQRPFSNW
jgi:hypothetical protein